MPVVFGHGIQRLEPLCICDHGPHEGECSEEVRVFGGVMPCGCDEYFPRRTRTARGFYKSV